MKQPETQENNPERPPAMAGAHGSDFLPLFHDMLSMAVPADTAMRWHNAIWLLKSHAENMADNIELESGGAKLAAKHFREAMNTIRPNNKLTDANSTEA